MYVHEHEHEVVVDFILLYSVWLFFLSSLFSFSFCSLWCTMYVMVHVSQKKWVQYNVDVWITCSFVCVLVHTQAVENCSSSGLLARGN